MERACRLIFGEHGDAVHRIWEQALGQPCDGSEGGHCSLLDGVKDGAEAAQEVASSVGGVCTLLLALFS